MNKFKYLRVSIESESTVFNIDYEDNKDKLYTGFSVASGYQMFRMLDFKLDFGGLNWFNDLGYRERNIFDNLVEIVASKDFPGGFLIKSTESDTCDQNEVIVIYKGCIIG